MRLSGLLQTAVAVCAAASPLIAQEQRVYRIGPGQILEPGGFGLGMLGMETPRAVIGVGTTSGTTSRDTLGVLVSTVRAGSPAEKVGLNGGQLELTVAGRDFLIGGDVITKINGIALSSPDKLLEALNALQVGCKLQLQVFRQDKYVDVSYLLPERPILPGDTPDRVTMATARTTQVRARKPVLRF